IQAVTSISEQTLSLIPKMLAVVGTVLLLLPWIVEVVLEFSARLFTLLQTIGPGGQSL
ncbi:MAG: flagellar biosynthetic protein FliQ, partial [Phycisphaerales bacterium]|nr:flagellar biosynthetic protein FliQ [Phycisphaerales bacterium]